MNPEEHKEEKYTIVNLCGINYKATHRNSSSINNRFLLFLAQIKYFIKFCSKQLTFYIRKIAQPILHHVMTNYEQPVILMLSAFMTLGIGYTIMAIIIDVIIVGFGVEPAKHDDDQFNHLASHPPNAGLLSLILTHIIVYSFRLVVIMIFSVIGIYCLSHIALFVIKIISFALEKIKSNIVNFYFKIPEVEPVDQTDFV